MPEDIEFPFCVVCERPILPSEAYVEAETDDGLVVLVHKRCEIKLPSEIN